jgi:hypothetical protein
MPGLTTLRTHPAGSPAGAPPAGRPGHLRLALALIATAVAAAALAATFIPPPPAAAAPPARPLAVWAVERDFTPPVPLAHLTALWSYFDLVQPGEHAPGRWDACYLLKMRHGTTVAVWASTHNQTPPGRIAARPWFGSTQWDLWAGDGPLTFTVAYHYDTTAATIPARKWTYGTVYLRAMLNWLTAHRYLTGREQLAGVVFGWEFASAGGADRSFTLRRYTLAMEPGRGES